MLYHEGEDDVGNADGGVVVNGDHKSVLILLRRTLSRDDVVVVGDRMVERMPLTLTIECKLK